MVYLGGTDEGRAIPEFLNETRDGERHIVITQNGLADGSYLKYLELLYHDQLVTLTKKTPSVRSRNMPTTPGNDCCMTDNFLTSRNKCALVKTSLMTTTVAFRFPAKPPSWR